MRIFQFNTIFFLFLTFLGHIAFAQGTPFEVTRNTKLHIQCAQAQIKLIGSAAANLNVLSNSTNVSVRKDPIEDLIRVECEESDSKTSVAVQGAGVSTQLNIRSGSISIQDWSGDVHSVLEKGTLVSKKTIGSLKFFMTSGQMDIQNHVGKLKIETFNSKLNVSNIEGILEVSNFLGATQIKAIKGDVVLSSRNGALDVVDVTGSVKYDTDNGRLDFAQINGNIEGESDQANVTMKLQNPVRLKAKVKNGVYKILVPATSGAQVSMAFEDGQFQVPSFLKQDNYGTTKTVRGTLRGGETGRVNLTGDAARVNLQTF